MNDATFWNGRTTELRTAELRKTLFDADTRRLRGALALAPAQMAADDFESPTRNEPGL